MPNDERFEVIERAFRAAVGTHGDRCIVEGCRVKSDGYAALNTLAALRAEHERLRGLIAEAAEHLRQRMVFGAWGPQSHVAVLYAFLDAMEQAVGSTQEAKCKYGDPFCPCQEGDSCNHEPQAPDNASGGDEAQES